jgi:hypothetical protein
MKSISIDEEDKQPGTSKSKQFIQTTPLDEEKKLKQIEMFKVTI